MTEYSDVDLHMAGTSPAGHLDDLADLTVVLARPGGHDTVSVMLSPVPPRGFTMLEIAVVLLLVGLLAAMTAVSFSAVTESSSTAEAKHTLRSVAVAEQLRFTSRGTFTDDPTTLTNLDPAWSYVSGATASTQHEEVSVALVRYGDLDAVALAAIGDNECTALIVVDPSLASPDELTWEAADGECSAMEALARAEGT